MNHGILEKVIGILMMNMMNQKMLVNQKLILVLKKVYHILHIIQEKKMFYNMLHHNQKHLKTQIHHLNQIKRKKIKKKKKRKKRKKL